MLKGWIAPITISKNGGIWILATLGINYEWDASYQRWNVALSEEALMTLHIYYRWAFNWLIDTSMVEGTNKGNADGE